MESSKEDAVEEMKFFGVKFNNLIKIIAFVSITSLAGVYAVSDGWEMQKLIL